MVVVFVLYVCCSRCCFCHTSSFFSLCAFVCCGNAFHIFTLHSIQVFDLQIKAKTDNVASINVTEINFVGLTVDAGGDTKYPLLAPVSRYKQYLCL